MALSKEQRKALRARGINPKYFDPRMVGDYRGFEFTGDFGADLRSLNEIYNQPQGPRIDWSAEDVVGGVPGSRNAANRRNDDYMRALDSLFQQYPDQATFQKNQGGRNMYLDVGVPYFRQGDDTGYFEGSQLGDYGTYHINNDSDMFDSIMSLPPINALANVMTGGLSSVFTGGEMGGGPGWLDAINLATDIADYSGPGSTSGDAPRAPDELSSIYDPPPEIGEDDTIFPGLDVTGPGGLWDLINIETPGGGSPPSDAAPPAAPAPVPDPAPPAAAEPEQPTPPWLEPEPGDPDYIPDPPTEAPPAPAPGPSPSPGGGDVTIPPIDWDWGSNGGNDDMSQPIDWTDWLPGVLDGVSGGDWSQVLNPYTSSSATGGSSNVNIDFGDLAEALLTIGGGYAGWDQSQQDPQYPTINDLYGGEYADAMKGLRDQILAQDPSSWVADLTPQQLQAIESMSGWAGGPGADIFGGQMGQGAMGLAGLGSGMGYADYLRQTGGPQFEYDQDVFNTTMQNLMPGVAGSYLDQTRDIVRGLNEQILPGIEMDAFGTGNTAASRTGIATGIAERGARDRMSDIESRLLTNALNQAHAAGYGAGGQTLGARMGTQGDIFGGYGTTAQYGLPGFNEAWRSGVGNMGVTMDAGNFMQNYNQALLDAPRNLLGWQIPAMNLTTPAGVGNLGTPYTGPSPLTGMMEGINLGSGIYDAWQNVFNNPFSTATNAGAT